MSPTERDPVPDGGGRRAPRPTVRAATCAPAHRRRPARPARDRPDPGRRRGVLPRLPALALVQHQHAVGRPEGAGRHAWRNPTACSSCRSSSTARPSTRAIADSTPVIQLESAMGAAIGSFPGASLLHVPRTRFAPGQDHRRPARPALRRLRGHRGPARSSRSRARRRPAVRRARQALLPAHRRVRAALPGRRAVAARGAAAGGARRCHLRRRRPRARRGGAGRRVAHHDRPRHGP